MKKERTLNELRQVKEYGWTPEPTDKSIPYTWRSASLAKKLDNAIKNEINSKQDQVARKLDMILDLEDIIQTEMVKVGLHPSEYPEHEFELQKAFEELFEYALKDLRYHYFTRVEDIEFN